MGGVTADPARSAAHGEAGRRRGPRVALATLPPGDLALLEALGRKGARPAPVIWSSPDVDWAQYDLVDLVPGAADRAASVLLEV